MDEHETVEAFNLGSDYMVGGRDKPQPLNPLTPWLNLHQERKLSECWDMARQDVCLLVERMMVLRREHGETATQIALRLNPPKRQGQS